MSTAEVSKICCVCGIDVSGQKRTKDAKGRYYCNPCWSSASAAATKTRTSPSLVVPAITPPPLPTAQYGGQPTAQAGGAANVTAADFKNWAIFAAIFVLLCIGIIWVVDKSPDQIKKEKAEKEAEARQKQDGVDAERATQDRYKAEEMRRLGMHGSDEELARTYDRAKRVDDTRQFQRDQIKR